MAEITRVIFGTHALTLADQAVVSGTSLLSTVLVGRCAQPSQLGVYTIGLSILRSVLAVQDARILMPCTIQRHRSSRSPKEMPGSRAATLPASETARSQSSSSRRRGRSQALTRARSEIASTRSEPGAGPPLRRHCRRSRELLGPARSRSKM